MAIIGYFDSLAEVQKLVTDRLLAGIVQEIIEEGQLLPVLPVTQLDAKSLVYNREGTLPTAGFYDIGEEIPSEAQATMTQVTVTLKRIIGQWDLDNFIRDTYRDPNDIEAQAVSMARKGVMRFAEDRIIYGNNTSNAKEFNGLQALVPASQRINQGSAATGAALSLANLDLLIDSVKGGPPDRLVMTFEIFRRISASGRGGTTNFPLLWMMENRPNVAGWVEGYRGIPIVRSDYITQTETISAGDFAAKTGGATSTIFAYRAGSVEMGGLTLLAGNPMFENLRIILENKDAERFRLKWYPALALGSTKSLACIDGITNVAVVA
jgi:hypothetical protein